MRHGSGQCGRHRCKLDEGLQEKLQALSTEEKDHQFNVLIELPDHTVIRPGSTPEQLSRQLDSAAERLAVVTSELDGVRVEQYRPIELMSAVSARMNRDQIHQIARLQQVIRISHMRLKPYLLLDKSGPLVGAHAVHSDDLDGTGVVVAVLDNGIDASHPALSGKVLDCDWKSPVTEPEGGYADNEHHGTHVAGIIASGDELYRGVAFGCRLLDIKVANKAGHGQDDWLLAGLDWLVQGRARGKRGTYPDVANLSLGIGIIRDHFHLCPDRLRLCKVCLAVEKTVAAGITVVVAAGNDGNCSTSFNQINCPGNAPSAITVAASDINDNIAYFSSRGPGVNGGRDIKPNLCAPGERIMSCGAGGAFEAQQGTSMAAPHVSGACALLLQQFPDLKPGHLKMLLMKSAKNLGRPWVEQGQGRLDIMAALAIADEINFSEMEASNVSSISYNELVSGFLAQFGITMDGFMSDPANYVAARFGLCPEDEAFMFHITRLMSIMGSLEQPDPRPLHWVNIRAHLLIADFVVAEDRNDINLAEYQDATTADLALLVDEEEDAICERVRKLAEAVKTVVEEDLVSPWPGDDNAQDVRNALIEEDDPRKLYVAGLCWPESAGYKWDIGRELGQHIRTNGYEYLAWAKVTWPATRKEDLEPPRLPPDPQTSADIKFA